MSTLSTFINETLYPALFDHLPDFLPDFDFKRAGPDKWVSRFKIDGSTAKSGAADKTAVLRRLPFCLCEWGEPRQTILNHAARRDNLEFADVLRKAAELSAVKLPEREMAPEEVERARLAELQREILETANAWLIGALYNPSNDWRAGAEAAAVEIKRRKYTPDLLRRPDHEDGERGERMELGFLPTTAALFAHLTSGGRFEADQVDDALRLPQNAVGRLSVALRERGRLVGFAFRALADEKPKYLYQAGADPSRRLFGLPRRLDPDQPGGLVLVEGVLDQAHAHARGLVNVASIGGATLHPEQIERARRAGAKAFTVCFDSDAAGLKATRAAVDQLLSHTATDPAARVYVVRLPAAADGEKNDLDSILRAGEDPARAVLGAAIDAARWLALDLEARALVDAEAGALSEDLRRAKVIDETIRAAAKLTRADDIRYFRQEVERRVLEPYSIEPAAVYFRADQLRQIQAEADYRRAAADKARQAAELFGQGKTEDAERELSDIAAERARAKAGQFDELLQRGSEASTRERLANRPRSIETSYQMTFDGVTRPLRLPTGALSVFAARPNHGKTPMLVNLSIDLAERAEDGGEVHFFTYEETAEDLELKGLNCFLDMDLSGKFYQNTDALAACFGGEFDAIPADKLADFEARKSAFFQLIEGGRLNFHFADYPAERLADAIRVLHRRRKIAAVVVDYIQLLNLENPRRNFNRQEEMKAICNLLKDVARETGLPLIFAAQFRRDPTLNEKTMSMDHLREAGDIEQTAALVVGIWNRAKDNGKDVNGEPNPLRPEWAVRVLKFRGHALGAAVWQWNGNRYKIGGAILNAAAASNGNGSGIKKIGI